MSESMSPGRVVDALGNPEARREFSLRRAYRDHFGRSPRYERMFIASVAFFLGFGAARTVTSMIRAQVGPFHNMEVGGRHLHHMVFGIGGLLGIGYLWLLLVGTDHMQRRTASRLTAGVFGLAAALTLDEFALWLNLQDVYWSKQGRSSVDAVAAFGGLLSIGVWGGPFFRNIVHELRRVVRHSP
ncbi:MAG: hypothetical protein J2P38_06835 [Candidatus Dormibacteraeota bacterium]|nr:hypothetical protein [Candidatus Dormibacteraeota bacterium]